MELVINAPAHGREVCCGKRPGEECQCPPNQPQEPDPVPPVTDWDAVNNSVTWLNENVAPALRAATEAAR